MKTPPCCVLVIKPDVSVVGTVGTLCILRDVVWVPMERIWIHGGCGSTCCGSTWWVWLDIWVWLNMWVLFYMVGVAQHGECGSTW